MCRALHFRKYDPVDVKVDANIALTVGVDNDATTNTEYATKRRGFEFQSL